jgi:hypothetical protein
VPQPVGGTLFFKFLFMPHIKQDKPFIKPTTDGKLIEEHFGALTNEVALSIAHMLVPAGCSEPFQNPGFDEYTLVSRGKKCL